jgi:ketosteroid isomerase-like protein
VHEYFRNWLSVFGDFDPQVEELIDAGDEVIAVLHERGRGKLSGAMVEGRLAHVWTVRDGKLWRLRSYATKQEALDAAGLRE